VGFVRNHQLVEAKHKRKREPAERGHVHCVCICASWKRTWGWVGGIIFTATTSPYVVKSALTAASVAPAGSCVTYSLSCSARAAPRAA
jgi:hypothetical protein